MITCPQNLRPHKLKNDIILFKDKGIQFISLKYKYDL